MEEEAEEEDEKWMGVVCVDDVDAYAQSYAAAEEYQTNVVLLFLLFPPRLTSLKKKKKGDKNPYRLVRGLM